MRLDKYSNPVFNDKDLFEALYSGYEFDPADTVLVESRTQDIQQLESSIGFKFLEPYETHFEIEDYDSACQQLWNMPEEYKNFDIEEWCLGKCSNVEQVSRVLDELEAFKARNMLDLLRWLKYFVDTCSKENIVWGLGRGSSVASYILYLIGVHSIDPIKYNLDWQEFLR